MRISSAQSAAHPRCCHRVRCAAAANVHRTRRTDTHCHAEHHTGTSRDVAVHHVGVGFLRLESVARMTTSCSHGSTDAAFVCTACRVVMTAGL